MIHQILKQTEDLRRDYPSFAWVPPENLHVPLYFIGEVDESEVSDIQKQIEDELYDVPVTHLYSFGAEIYINKSITIFMTFQRAKHLEMISKRIMGLFASDTQIKKFDFEPLVTLAKYKIPSKQQYLLLKKKLNRLRIDVEFPVKEIQLYESITRSKHPLYKKVGSVKLLKEDM